MLLTFVLLGFAYFKAVKEREKTGPWGLRVLHAVTALCIVLVIYTIILK